MLTDLEPAAPPPHFWSGKKVSLCLLGLILAMVAFAYLYDPPLKPWDDLKLDNPEKSDVTTNGYVYLKYEWSRMPPLDEDTRSAIRKMLMDPAAWISH